MLQIFYGDSTFGAVEDGEDDKKESEELSKR